MKEDGERVVDEHSAASPPPEEHRCRRFERYLTVWVALCIVAGVALGHVLPGVFQAIGSAEVAQ